MATVKRLKAQNWCKRNYPHSEQPVEMVKTWTRRTLVFFPSFLTRLLPFSSFRWHRCRKYGGNFAFLVFSVCLALCEKWENFKRVMHIFFGLSERSECRKNHHERETSISQWSRIGWKKKRRTGDAKILNIRRFSLTFRIVRHLKRCLEFKIIVL